MLDLQERELPLAVQTDLLTLNRTSLYYKPAAPSPAEVSIKHAIDRIYTENPSWGSRTITAILKREGAQICRNTVAKYMREMGIAAVYPGPNLSRRNPEHRIYPYLLSNITASYPNHIWGTDITYIRLRTGWLYLTVQMDWFSRYVIAWELDQTLEIDFVLECLRKALATATPAIANSDQGSQYTSPSYTDLLLEKEVKISMDGRGRATPYYSKPERRPSTPGGEPLPKTRYRLDELLPLTLQVVTTKKDRDLWSELIDRYHYLGCATFAGAQVRYLVHSPQGLVTVFGFSAVTAQD